VRSRCSSFENDVIRNHARSNDQKGGGSRGPLGKLKKIRKMREKNRSKDRSSISRFGMKIKEDQEGAEKNFSCEKGCTDANQT